jgi:hypothetical protein
MKSKNRGWDGGLHPRIPVWPDPTSGRSLETTPAPFSARSPEHQSGNCEAEEYVVDLPALENRWIGHRQRDRGRECA